MIVRKIFRRQRIEVKRELFRRLLSVPEGNRGVYIDGYYLLGIIPIYMQRTYL